MERILSGVLVMAVILTSAMVLGCSENAHSPIDQITSLPVFLIDIQENGTAIVYIHGLSETNYINITLRIGNMTLEKWNTYSLETKFHFNGSETFVSYAYDDDHRYYLNLTITSTVGEAGSITYTAVDRSGRVEKELTFTQSSMPWKRTYVLDREWDEYMKEMNSMKGVDSSGI